MNTYPPPVDKLLALGWPDLDQHQVDYRSLGIDPEQIPQLLRLLQDEELLAAAETAQNEDDPRWYARIHAWRALAQLRAQEAIEPLLDMVAENAVGDEWSDWVTEEVPTTIAQIGPQALPALQARLRQLSSHGDVSMAYTRVLEQIAEKNPETRAEVVAELCRMFETAATNNAEANGFILAALLDLKAVEAWPAIEHAFATGNVDEFIAGGIDDAKWELGLGAKPKPRSGFQHPPASGPRPTNAKQRFNERQRQKKLAKKQRKKKK